MKDSRSTYNWTCHINVYHSHIFNYNMLSNYNNVVDITFNVILLLMLV